MAHLGEAQGVIELFKLKKKSTQLFESETLNCLITGEGPFEAAATVAYELGQNKYTSVINLGIAGTFETDSQIGEIYPVRSIYLVIENKPQFKSFKSHVNGLDCITSFERILDSDKATKLSGLGTLVDREAWGVAFACKNVGIPFSSYKLISDLAGTLGACEIVREKSEDWSQRLALYLESVLKITPDQKEETHLPGFHLTFSTRHKLQDMLEKISLRDNLSISELLASLPLEEMRQTVSLPKERTRHLLHSLEVRLDPLKEKLDFGLNAFKAPFEKKGISLQHDSSWESPELKVSFSVTTTLELENKISELKKLDLAPFIDLRNGNFHVE